MANLNRTNHTEHRLILALDPFLPCIRFIDFFVIQQRTILFAFFGNTNPKIWPKIKHTTKSWITMNWKQKKRTNSKKNINISRDSLPKVQGQTPNTQKIVSFLTSFQTFSRLFHMQNAKRWRYFQIIRSELMIYRRRNIKDHEESVAFPRENRHCFGSALAHWTRCLSHHLLSHFIYLMGPFVCVNSAKIPTQTRREFTLARDFMPLYSSSTFGFVRAYLILFRFTVDLGAKVMIVYIFLFTRSEWKMEILPNNNIFR